MIKFTKPKLLAIVDKFPKNWKESFQFFTEMGHSFLSLPFIWLSSGYRGFCPTKILSVTRNPYRILFIQCILSISSLDSIYRTVTCTYADYGEMKMEEILQMYLDCFSRTGCTIIGWDMFLRRDNFAASLNYIMKAEELFCGIAKQKFIAK